MCIESPKIDKEAEAGFTLLQVLIGLMIASIIIIPFVQINNVVKERERITETRSGVARAGDYLQAYAQLHGSYPIPADPTLAITNPNVGVSVPLGSVPGSLVVTPAVGAPGNFIFIGALPVETLGVPLDEILDQYGGKYTYAITSGLTSFGAFDDRNGAITINSQSAGGTVPHTAFAIPADILPAPQYVVISHGENGGAYQQNGVRQPCPPAPAIENENCDDDSTFLALDNFSGVLDRSFNAAPGPNFFDDGVFTSSSIFVDLWSEGGLDRVLLTSGATTGGGIGRVNIGAAGIPNAQLRVVGDAQSSSDILTERLCDDGSGVFSSRNCFEIESITGNDILSASTLLCASNSGMKAVAPGLFSSGVTTQGRTTSTTSFQTHNAGFVTRDCDPFAIAPNAIVTNDCPTGSRGFDANFDLICN